VFFGFTAPGSEAEEVVNVGRGLTLSPVKMLDTASGVVTWGRVAALSGIEG
jgi:hypothetical protein